MFDKTEYEMQGCNAGLDFGRIFGHYTDIQFSIAVALYAYSVGICERAVSELSNCGEV